MDVFHHLNLIEIIELEKTAKCLKSKVKLKLDWGNNGLIIRALLKWKKEKKMVIQVVKKAVFKKLYTFLVCCTSGTLYCNFLHIQ